MNANNRHHGGMRPGERIVKAMEALPRASVAGIASEEGDLSLALAGSFLPLPTDPATLFPPLSAEEQAAHPEPFVYQIHSWIASLYVDCLPWRVRTDCPANPGTLRCPSPAAHTRDMLLIRGFGKTYGCTGWRLGYAAGPADLIAEMAKMCPGAATEGQIGDRWGLRRSE